MRPEIKFTQRQVLKEVKNILSGKLMRYQSLVYQEWISFHTKHFKEYDIRSLINYGFKGFFNSSPEEILIDFNNFGKLKIKLNDDQKTKLYYKIYERAKAKV